MGLQLRLSRCFDSYLQRSQTAQVLFLLGPLWGFLRSKKAGLRKTESFFEVFITHRYNDELAALASSVVKL